jgi:hypothetical protein
MKTFIRIAFVWVAITTYCAAQTATNAIEQTKDSIRVVLITLSRANVVPALTKTNPAVTGIRVVYLVEALGVAPFQNAYLGPMRITVDGRVVTISKRVDDETLITASEYQKFDWKKLSKPTVTNPRRVTIYEATLPYFHLPKGKTDIQVEAGFNLIKASFVFKDIAVE